MDDRNVKAITSKTKNLFGKFFGDKRYISKTLRDMLFGNGIQFIPDYSLETAGYW
jgi:hypothetical protein